MEKLNNFLKGWMLLVAILVLNTSESNSQTYFANTYGTSGYERAESVRQTSDGGYIVTGSQGTAGNYDIWLIKLDQNGDTTWTKTYGGTDEDVAYDVKQTTDGGYILAGYTKNYGPGAYAVYLIKTKANGDTSWTKAYGGSSWDYGRAVTQTSDGGYAIVGETWSFSNGVYDIYVIKTDSLGDTVWTNNYGGANYDYGYSIEQTTDNGYIIGGHTENYGAQGFDMYLLKLSSTGIEEWGKVYGGSANDKGYSAVQTFEGGYAIAGLYRSASNDIYIVKTNSSGTEEWNQVFDESPDDIAYSIEQTSDSGYVVAGYVNNVISGNSLDDLYLLKTDPSGNKEWAKYMGGTGTDKGASASQTTDNGYIVCGFTKSSGSGNEDYYVIRTNSSGTLSAQCDTAVANFNYSAISSFKYDFTSTSSFATSYLWDFDDGNSDTTSVPSHTFADTGSYTICLTASNSCTSDSICKIISISCPYPVSGFSSNVSGLNVTFSNSSTDSDSYYWDFGDSKTDTAQNPSHSYGTSGSYTVCLSTTNSCGNDTLCKTVTVCNITSTFTVSDSNACAGVTDVVFQYTGTGGINYQWFDNGTSFSTSAKANKVFSTTGNHSIMLVADDGNCNDTTTYDLTVRDKPSAGYSNTSNDLSITFTDASTDAIDWFWDFGDGKTDGAQNPTHIYADTGTYNVCLAVANGCGTDTLCKSVTVTNSALCNLNASFDATDSTICEDDSITFTSTSTGAASFKWKQDGVQFSTSSSVVQKFDEAGNFKIELIITDGGSCLDTASLDVTVNPKPMSFFNYEATGLQVNMADSSFNTNNWDWAFGISGSDTVQNPSFTFSDTGTYQICLTVTNSCGSDTLCKTVDLSDTSSNDTIGISNLTLQSFKIYPNPFKDKLTIELPKQISDRVTLKVYNVVGEMIIETNVSNGIKPIVLDMSEYSEGIYWITIRTQHLFANKQILMVR